MNHIYWTLQKVWKERSRDWQKLLLPLNINTIILKSRLLRSIIWVDLSLPICYDVSEIPKLHMDYNFHSGILFGNTHSKHILIILIIHSWNFKKMLEWSSEFEGDEDRTRNRKSNSLLMKRWNFSRISIFNPQNSIS